MTGLRQRMSRLADAAGRRYILWTTPTANGLPNAVVLAAFPVLLLIVVVPLIAVGINGWSTGWMHQFIDTGADPNLLAGHPQVTRTDEWNVQSVWAIAQVQQGLPLTNGTFPGGMDTTLPQDLPRNDITTFFRPHLWGFSLLPLDMAFAWKWWIPALLLMASVYCFVVTVLPRRPIAAAALAVGFYFSPLIQWWYLATTIFPLVWGFVALTAVLWALKTPRRLGSWLWALALAYLTVVMAMGIYVPFIIPVVIVVVFAVVGAILQAHGRGMRIGTLAVRAIPTVSGLVVGALVTVGWLVAKAPVVDAFLNTAYPGDRLASTGQGDLHFLAASIASSFSEALNTQGWGLLGPNASEASTFFFVGAFLIPVVVWAAIRLKRSEKRLPWMLLLTVAAIALFLAYVFVPGWDGLSRLFLLDRTTVGRLRMGIGFASFVIAVVLAGTLSARRLRAPHWLAGATAGVFLLSQLVIAFVAFRTQPQLLAAVPLWWLWALLSALCIYFFARARVSLAVACFLIVCVAATAGTNPVYRGVVDLRETPLSQSIIELDEAAPGTWVGVGSGMTTDFLLESGVEAFNGFQGAPSEQMWSAIDPDGDEEFEWNRLAGVSWVAGPGEPEISNPAPDQIVANFDGCSEFAAGNVDYVLSDAPDLDTSCLTELGRFTLPMSTMTVYEVVGAQR
ncbi:DUF7657 domain-containing protein [Compostimonas suwonensis]|uniref:4-amino-4-deoxy-L-arabinose transferase-like glycosyltransferase n=1 Tax=Compostimonas suwonensis TaxID=1048394 RepID=A0A2M9BUU7_9MICO|nr:hypothetical protein [Compostimonas suwonensis]PJJ61729.1 hypothetical protein CLV54_2679 [Compostimonas suwonensis]